MAALMNPEYLHKCFSYDSNTGRLTWRERPREHFKGGAGWHNFNNQFANKIAGVQKNDGRYEIKLDGKSFKAARIVWAMQTNTAIFGAIDHIDGNPANDRLSNLRVVSAAQNARNRSNLSNNSSGIRGVTWHVPSSKWWARVTFNNKTISLGLYSSISDAAKIVIETKQKLYGSFARA